MEKHCATCKKTLMKNYLKEIRQARGIRQPAVAEALSMSTSQVSRIETGESELTTTKMEKFAKFYDCTVSEIITGEHLVALVTVIGAVQAGEWVEALEWPEEDQYEIGIPVDEWKNHKLFSLAVRGPSMNKVYPDGTLLVCASPFEIKRDPAPGDRVIARRRNENGMIEATVKTLRLDKEGVRWLWPESDHPEHQAPLRVDDGEAVDIIGIVLAHYSRDTQN